MQLRVLASGSRGNCYLVRQGAAVVLVDAGIPTARVSEALAVEGIAADAVGAVLVTHEHSDHARHWQAYERAFPEASTYMTGGTWHALGSPPMARGRLFDAGARLGLPGGLDALAVPAPHDGREPVCYRLEGAGGASLGILSDLGHVSPEIRARFSDCRLLVLECNHDVQLLRNGDYPPALQARIAGDWGHLSNDAAREFLQSLQPRPERVVACHLSDANNRPGLVAQALAGLLPEGALEILAQQQPSEWMPCGA